MLETYQENYNEACRIVAEGCCVEKDLLKLLKWDGEKMNKDDRKKKKKRVRYKNTKKHARKKTRQLD
jgi:hypothetical protein